MAGHEQMWPADSVERWPVDRLIPYARNARQHSPEQIAQIAASIKEWGWTIPVLAEEDGGLICGHGRLQAARKLGLDEIPVMVARGWSEAQKRAYVVADNQLTLNATWDTELLGLELGELQGLEFDLQLTGFGEQELTALLSGEPGGPGDGSRGVGSLSAQFGVPPFTVLNAREGWWQDRKRAWMSLGIQSELGRGEGSLDEAAPGGQAMPAASLENGKTVRGDGRARKANAVPGGGKMPLDRGYA